MANIGGLSGFWLKRQLASISPNLQAAVENWWNETGLRGNPVGVYGEWPAGVPEPGSIAGSEQFRTALFVEPPPNPVEQAKIWRTKGFQTPTGWTGPWTGPDAGAGPEHQPEAQLSLWQEWMNKYAALSNQYHQEIDKLWSNPNVTITGQLAPAGTNPDAITRAIQEQLVAYRNTKGLSATNANIADGFEIDWTKVPGGNILQQQLESLPEIPGESGGITSLTAGESTTGSSSSQADTTRKNRLKVVGDGNVQRTGIVPSYLGGVNRIGPPGIPQPTSFRAEPMAVNNLDNPHAGGSGPALGLPPGAEPGKTAAGRSSNQGPGPNSKKGWDGPGGVVIDGVPYPQWDGTRWVGPPTSGSGTTPYVERDINGNFIPPNPHIKPGDRAKIGPPGSIPGAIVPTSGKAKITGPFWDVAYGPEDFDDEGMLKPNAKPGVEGMMRKRNDANPFAGLEGDPRQGGG